MSRCSIINAIVFKFIYEKMPCKKVQNQNLYEDRSKRTQHKGRRIQSQLQNQVDIGIENPLNYCHIERVNEIQGDVFIQPTVLNVEDDGSVNIALDTRALIESKTKDIYQMHNLDNLIELIAEKLYGRKG